MTVKSDDVNGRTKTYEAIVKGENVPTPGIPESFKVLVKELQSLCLNIQVLDKDGNEIELSDLIEEDTRIPMLLPKEEDLPADDGDEPAYEMVDEEDDFDDYDPSDEDLMSQSDDLDDFDDFDDQ